MATMPQFVPSEVVHDLDFPQREAAFFYGLFLRGHSRTNCGEISKSPPWFSPSGIERQKRDPQLRDIFARMVDYRRHVLAIFDNLCRLGYSTATRSIVPTFSPACRRNCGQDSHVNTSVLAMPSSLYLRSGSKTVKQPNKRRH